MLLLVPAAQKNKQHGSKVFITVLNLTTFIDRIEIKKDTITRIRLRPNDFQPKDGLTRLSTIHEAIQQGDTCYLHLGEWDKVREKLFFTVISITDAGNNRFLMVPGFKRYTSLEECKRQQYPDPGQNFYFTLYKQKDLDSFKKLPKLNTLDTGEICNLITDIKNEIKHNEEKMKKISSYDMYLSGSSKEVINRVFIKAGINPIDYTNDEGNEAFMKCEQFRDAQLWTCAKIFNWKNKLTGIKKSTELPINISYVKKINFGCWINATNLHLAYWHFRLS